MSRASFIGLGVLLICSSAMYSSAQAMLPNDSTILESTLRDLSNKPNMEEETLRLRQSLSLPSWPVTGKFIVVNVAEGMVIGVENNEVTFQSPAIVGQVKKPTPLFTSEVRSITFNPTWHISSSIKMKDGETAIPPGPRNPLGHIRINIPNNEAIYLHSTNQKYLFKRKHFTYSHGCVRVEHAVDLAHWILGDEMWKSISGERLSQEWVEKTFLVKQHIPVLIEYRTASIDAEGKVSYHKDPYGLLKEPQGLLKEDAKTSFTTY